MERGKFLTTMPFFDNYFVMSISSFTMQIFNHDHSYIVMERGKFLYYANFFWQCLQVPFLCRLLTMTIPILSWNVANSSALCHFFDNYFVMSTSSFTMQTFNDDNSYIVMERGKFLSTMPIFFDNYFCHVYKFLYYAEF